MQQRPSAQEVQQQRDHLRQTIGRGFDQPKEISDGIQTGYLQSLYQAYDINSGIPLLNEGVGAQVVSASSLSHAGIPNVRAPTIDGADNVHTRPRSKFFNGDLILRNKRQNRGPLLLPHLDDGPMKRMRLLPPEDPAGAKRPHPNLPVSSAKSSSKPVIILEEREKGVVGRRVVEEEERREGAYMEEEKAPPRRDGGYGVPPLPPGPPPTPRKETEYTKMKLTDPRIMGERGIPMDIDSNGDGRRDDDDQKAAFGVKAGNYLRGTQKVPTTVVEPSRVFVATRETPMVDVALSVPIASKMTKVEPTPIPAKGDIMEEMDLAHANISDDVEILASQKNTVVNRQKAPGEIVHDPTPIASFTQDVSGQAYDDESQRSGSLKSSAMALGGEMKGAVELMSEIQRDKQHLFESDEEYKRVFAAISNQAKMVGLETPDFSDRNEGVKKMLAIAIKTGEVLGHHRGDLMEKNLRLDKSYKDLLEMSKNVDMAHKKEIDETLGALRRLKAENQNRIQQQGVEIIQLKTSLQDISKSLSEKEGELARLLAKENYDKVTVEDLRTRINTIKGERDNFRLGVKQLNEKIKVSDEKASLNINRLEEEVEQLKFTLKSKDDNLKDLASRLVRMDQSYQESCRQIETMNRDRERGTGGGDAIKLKKRVENYEKEIEQLKGVLATREVEKLARVKTIDDLTQQQEQMRGLYKQQLREYQEKASKWAKSFQEEEKARQSELFNLDKQDFENRIAQLGVQIETHKTRVGDLNQKMVEAEKQYYALSTDKKRIEFELTNSKEVYEKLTFDHNTIINTLKSRFGEYISSGDLITKIDNFIDKEKQVVREEAHAELNKFLDSMRVKQEEREASLIGQARAEIAQRDEAIMGIQGHLEATQEELAELAGATSTMGDKLQEQSEIAKNAVEENQLLRGYLDEMGKISAQQSTTIEELKRAETGGKLRANIATSAAIEAGQLCSQVLQAFWVLKEPLLNSLPENARGGVDQVFTGLSMRSSDLLTKITNHQAVFSDQVAVQNTMIDTYFNHFQQILSQHEMYQGGAEEPTIGITELITGTEYQDFYKQGSKAMADYMSDDQIYKGMQVLKIGDMFDVDAEGEKGTLKTGFGVGTLFAYELKNYIYESIKSFDNAFGVIRGEVNAEGDLLDESKEEELAKRYIADNIWRTALTIKENGEDPENGFDMLQQILEAEALFDIEEETQKGDEVNAAALRYQFASDVYDIFSAAINFYGSTNGVFFSTALSNFSEQRERLASSFIDRSKRHGKLELLNTDESIVAIRQTQTENFDKRFIQAASRFSIEAPSLSRG